jgi:ribosomal protein L21E
MKTQVETELKNGKKTIIEIDGGVQELLDKIQFTNDTGFVIDKEGYYILVNQIARFKPIGG